MKTPEQQIRSLKLQVCLSWCMIVILVIMYIKAGRIHHVEGFYLDNDMIEVTVEGNNSLDFLPFQQTISIERMSPPDPDNQDHSATKEEHHKRVAAATSAKTPVQSWHGSFKGPMISSPFLRKREGTQSYEVANVCDNMKQLVRNPDGNWAVEPAQGLPAPGR